MGTLEERFWEKVDVGDPDECWEWTAGRFTDGYGGIEDLDQHKKLKTHRLSFILANGEIPDGLHVCHTCDNPPCCNPGHLFLGTTLDNAQDKKLKGRERAPLAIEEVREIRRLAECGVSEAELAEKFEVHKISVRRILTGKTWGNLS